MKKQLNAFLKLLSSNGCQHRYASYDFCYVYFQSNKGNLSQDMEKSCFCLWGYLASWGMLRGSSDLLRKSPAVLKNLIMHFDQNANDRIWTIDVGDANYIDVVLDEYEAVKKLLNGVATETDTLITKIMLGVYGAVPAFDKYFKSTFSKLYPNGGFSSVNRKSLTNIVSFYKKHSVAIGSFKQPCIDFNGGNTQWCYKKAKLIDMYGFQSGMPLQGSKAKKTSNKTISTNP